MSEVVAAFDDGRAIMLVACQRLGPALDATAVAHVETDQSTGVNTAHLWSRALPDGVVLVGQGPLGTDPPADWWRWGHGLSAVADACAGASIAEVTTHSGSTVQRKLVVARRGGLTPAHLHLLDVASQPLSLVDAHRDRLEALQRRLSELQGRLAAVEAAPRGERTARVNATSTDRSETGTARTSPTRVALTAPASGRPEAHALTPRELEVLQMLAEGLLARAIAHRLCVSPRTVHKHLGSVYRKLDSHDRLVAVSKAHTLGLLG